MTDTKYKPALENELTILKKELGELGIQNPEVAKDWIPVPPEPSDAEPDPNDLGDRSEDWQEARGTLDALETRFNNIKKALKKIEAGEFGKCELCGEDIESDRLEANPSARTCKAHLEDENQLTN